MEEVYINVQSPLYPCPRCSAINTAVRCKPPLHCSLVNLQFESAHFQCPPNLKSSIVNPKSKTPHSALSEFTGFAVAALIDRNPTVSKAIMAMTEISIISTHHVMVNPYE